MTKATNQYRSICHRDNTVTVWDVLAQQWLRRVDSVSDAVLSCLPHSEVDRIVAHLGI